MIYPRIQQQLARLFVVKSSGEIEKVVCTFHCLTYRAEVDARELSQISQSNEKWGRGDGRESNFSPGNSQFSLAVVQKNCISIFTIHYSLNGIAFSLPKLVQMENENAEKKHHQTNEDDFLEL